MKKQQLKQQGTTNKLSEVEIIRYQVLIPVTEVQVRSISSGRDSQCSNDGMDSRPITPGLTSPLSAPISGEKISSGGQPASSSSSVSNAVASDEQQTASKTGGSVSQYIWELIHLRCTQIPGGTQRRTEKVYQLSNRFVYMQYAQYPLRTFSILYLTILYSCFNRSILCSNFNEEILKGPEERKREFRVKIKIRKPSVEICLFRKSG